MPDSFNLPVTYYNISLTVKYRLGQFWYVITIILIFSLSIHYNIAPKAYRCLKPCHKSPCKALIHLESDNVVRSALPGYLRCPVTASVINDKYFNRVNACYSAGNSLNCLRQSSFFIETWNLHNKFHSKIPFQIPPRPPFLKGGTYFPPLKKGE